MAAPRKGSHTAVLSKRIPKVSGSYSQAILLRQPVEWLFVSQQLPLELPRQNVLRNRLDKQIELCWQYVRYIAQDGGFQLADMVRCTWYLANMEDLAEAEKVCQKVLALQVYPARSILHHAGLPKGVLFAVDAVLAKSVAPEVLAEAAAAMQKGMEDDDM